MKRIPSHVLAQGIYYLGWILMVVFETTLWSVTGIVLGILVFTAGSLVWAAYEIRHTHVAQPLYGPVLGLMDHILRKGRHRKPWRKVPRLVTATLLGGAPGVGLVLKKQGSSHTTAFIVTAAAIYAGIWAAIHLLRPQAGVPVGLWPTLALFHLPF